MPTWFGPRIWLGTLQSQGPSSEGRILFQYLPGISFQGSLSLASVAFCCDPIHQPLPLGGKETRSQVAAALPSPRSVGDVFLLHAPEQPVCLGKSQSPEVSQGGFDPRLAASLARQARQNSLQGRIEWRNMSSWSQDLE